MPKMSMEKLTGMKPSTPRMEGSTLPTIRLIQSHYLSLLRPSRRTLSQPPMARWARQTMVRWTTKVTSLIKRQMEWRASQPDTTLLKMSRVELELLTRRSSTSLGTKTPRTFHRSRMTLGTQGQLASLTSTCRWKDQLSPSTRLMSIGSSTLITSQTHTQVSRAFQRPTSKNSWDETQMPSWLLTYAR